MSTPVKLYHQEMHANLGFFGTWLPGDLLQLGDVGILTNGRFRAETTLTGAWSALGGKRKGISAKPPVHVEIGDRDQRARQRGR